MSQTASVLQLENLLSLTVKSRASDLLISVGTPPSIKVNGEIKQLMARPLKPGMAKDLVAQAIRLWDLENFQANLEQFLRNREANFGLSIEGLARFRVSAYYQRNTPAMVIRRIQEDVPDIETLNLPPILKDLAMTKRGLIIFVGATGTGKSTSLAAMLKYRNHNSSGHIITIEDPIEYTHRHAGCIVDQREVGTDTESYEVALKNTLRQAPDVILIGEIRTRETMQHAVTFAETGHLVLSTLHANNANQALDRIIHFFPEEMRDQVFMDLSLNLKAIVAQQLVRSKDGKRRLPVVEILLNTPHVADLIRRGEVHNLKEIMARSGNIGMSTFDQCLIKLALTGEIDDEEAVRCADSVSEVRRALTLGKRTDGKGESGDGGSQAAEIEIDWSDEGLV